MKRFFLRFFNSFKRILLYISGRDCTPSDHFYKEKIVKKYASKYRCNVFLETGTYRGEMDEAVYNTFDYLASVEIQKKIHEMNLEKFSGFDKLHLYCGDSTFLIPIMLEEIKYYFKKNNYKICFWLDGHYSAGDTGRGEKDTPIMEEIKGIKKSDIGDCVILIDDARCFTHEGEFADYPTIPTLKKYVNEQFEKNSFVVRGDIIRIIVKS